MAKTLKKDKLVQAPQAPSKWDIIPIHTSDRMTFKQCRRKWGWSSPSRRNLIPRIASHGVYIPFWFGKGCHYALERYYASHKVELPKDTFESWFHLQWNGGLVHESELDKYADRDPVPGPTPETYHVTGLNELVSEDQAEEILQHRELGIGMMEYYVDYADRMDDFEVVATEHTFSVPILDPDGNVLYAVDNRVMPKDWEPDLKTENKYGPLVKEFLNITNGEVSVVKQVHARGRMDIIVRLENGAYAIRDYKTTSKLDDDYFRHLELDEQCTTYLWAAEREAQDNDLEYKSIDYIDYVALRKNYPRPPRMLANGLPSVDRQKESTTPEMFDKCIKENNLQIVFDGSSKLQEYYGYLVTQGDKQFIWPERTRRNKAQKYNAGLRLYFEALDMLDKDIVLYPNPSKDFSCLKCIFRAPCIAAEDGSQWEAMLEGNYIKNYDR